MKSKFILIAATQDQHEAVLCTEQPFIIFSVWKFKSDFESNDFQRGNSLVYYRINGYNIVLCLSGSLSRFTVTPDYKEDLKQLITGAAEWYYEHAIQPKLGKYRRYLWGK